jgi:hypothetical protein
MRTLANSFNSRLEWLWAWFNPTSQRAKRHR